MSHWLPSPGSLVRLNGFTAQGMPGFDSIEHAINYNGDLVMIHPKDVAMIVSLVPVEIDHEFSGAMIVCLQLSHGRGLWFRVASQHALGKWFMAVVP